MISTQADEAEALARETETQGTGRNPGTRRLGAEDCAATSGRTKSEDHALMERVVERSNMRLAYPRVVQNEGAAGVDGLTVHWPSVKRALLEGGYLPQAVRRVDIAKPSDGVRTLGVLDNGAGARE
jgi:hypothetical protein